MWIFILFGFFLFVWGGSIVKWLNAWAFKSNRLNFSFWFDHILTCVTLNKLPRLCGFQFLICKMVH